jgi:hypothetical protein
LGLRLDKSLQTSDWGAATLSDAQLVYAALDAWVSQQLVRSLHAAAEARGEQQALREYVRPHVGVRVVGARTTRQSERRADGAETNARAGKATARFGTRKAPLYENCRILAPDGEGLLHSRPLVDTAWSDDVVVGGGCSRRVRGLAQAPCCARAARRRSTGMSEKALPTWLARNRLLSGAHCVFPPKSTNDA